MTSAAMSALEVVDLARSRTVAFERQHAPLEKAASLPWRLTSFLMDVASTWVERYLHQQARRLADQAVWFRGARAEVEESMPECMELDANDSLRALLDESEDDLRSGERNARELLARIQSNDGERRSRVRNALQELVERSVELRTEVRWFKAAVQAHDASYHTLQAAAGTPCESAEQIDAALDGLMSKA